MADPELLLGGGANHQPGAPTEYINKIFRKNCMKFKKFWSMILHYTGPFSGEKKTCLPTRGKYEIDNEEWA